MTDGLDRRGPPDRSLAGRTALRSSGDAALAPMLARQVNRFPAGSSAAGLRFEPKWDGYRAFLVVDHRRGVGLVGRHGKLLGRGFPEVVLAGHDYLPADTILDGELVVWSVQNRLDFAALQHRQASGRAGVERLVLTEPAHLIVFDVLRFHGADMTAQPLYERRAYLEDLFAGIPGWSALALGLQTPDVEVARAWFDTLAPVGIGGIILKPAASPYLPGGRDTWQKIEHSRSTLAVIGGVTGSLTVPRSLLLGRYTATGKLTVIGRTVRLHAADSAAVAAELVQVGDDHPWPPTLPADLAPVGDASYVRVPPGVVAELSADNLTRNGLWTRPARFLRLRPDRSPADTHPPTPTSNRADLRALRFTPNNSAPNTRQSLPFARHLRRSERC